MRKKLGFSFERGKKWLMGGLSFAVLCTLFTVLIFELTKKQVTVVLDGEKQEMAVHAESVKGLLSDLNVDVTSHDLVEPGRESSLESGMTVKWTPAVEVMTKTDGVAQPTWTTAKTVGALLKEKNIEVAKHDTLTPDAETKIKDGMAITYKSASPIQVKVGDKKQKIWSTASAFTTVKGFLNKNDIAYDKNDEIKPGLDTPVRATSNVTVNHVKTTTDVVYQTLDYDVVKREDDSLPKGEKRVINAGTEGKKALHYKITKKNGKEVKRKRLKTETKQPSKKRVIAVGTKSAASGKKDVSSSEETNKKKVSAQQSTTANSSSSSGSSNGSKEKNHANDSEKKSFYVNSTAYTANCGSGCSGTTRTGIDLTANPNAKVIAVDPNVIPLGSKVWVEGYGQAIAGDTGGDIKGKRIDVFVSSNAEVSTWGHRKVQVKILD